LKEEEAVFISGNIEKGVNWFDSIIGHLKNSKAGIVCLAPENLQSPWQHFEAGALAMGFAFGKEAPSNPPLFTLLHGVTGAELKGPLSAYQSTSTTRPEMEALVGRVTKILGKTVPGDSITEDDWKKFQDALNRSTVKVSQLIPNLESMFQRKTFNEPLHHCADQAWLERYEGARITHERLDDNLSRVRAVCSPYEQGLFEMLLRELDGYAMAIRSLLLVERKPFKLLDNGELEIDTPTKTCCEDRRLAIRSLAGRLLHPLDEPQKKEEAVRFMAAETNEERKMIIHRLEGAIRLQREPTYVKPSGVDAALEKLTDKRPPIVFRQSSWDLDRIFYYLLIQYFETFALHWEPRPENQAGGSVNTGGTAPVTVTESAGTIETPPPAMDNEWFCAARDVELEVERFRAKSKGGSLMPLTYALVALQALKPQNASENSDARRLVLAALDLVKKEFQNLQELDGVRPIARLLDDMRPSYVDTQRSMGAATTTTGDKSKI